MVSITGKDIGKRVMFKPILDSVDVFINHGEVTGLIGMSGSGKTTLLKILSLFDSKYSGKLRFIPLEKEDNILRMIGYVNQSDILNPNLEVLDTLKYTYSIRNNKEDPDSADIIMDLLEMFNMKDRVYHKLKKLSGGERKRVHIINELIALPVLLFLDEPLSGLDPANADRILMFLRDYAGKGNTVVMTTHSTDSIEHLDRIFFLNRGKLIFYGKPAEIPDYFGVEDISESYRKISRQNPDFLRRMFQKSDACRKLKSFLDITAEYPADTAVKDKLRNSETDAFACRDENRKDDSIDEEYRKIISSIVNGKEE